MLLPFNLSENHVVVGEILESKSAHVNTPKSLPVEANWNLDSEASHTTGGYSVGFSLTVLQVTKINLLQIFIKILYRKTNS